MQHVVSIEEKSLNSEQSVSESMSVNWPIRELKSSELDKIEENIPDEDPIPVTEFPLFVDNASNLSSKVSNSSSIGSSMLLDPKDIPNKTKFDYSRRDSRGKIIKNNSSNEETKVNSNSISVSLSMRVMSSDSQLNKRSSSDFESAPRKSTFLRQNTKSKDIFCVDSNDSLMNENLINVSMKHKKE